MHGLKNLPGLLVPNVTGARNSNPLFNANTRCKHLAPWNLSEDPEVSCFRVKSWMARRDEGEHPSWVFDRGSTKPAGILPETLRAAGPLSVGRVGLVAIACWGYSSTAAAPVAILDRLLSGRIFLDTLRGRFPIRGRILQGQAVTIGGRNQNHELSL